MRLKVSNLFLIILISIIVSGNFSQANIASSNRKTVIAYFAKEPIEIDGNTNELWWRRSPTYQLEAGEETLKQGFTIEETGTVKITWCDNGLIIAGDFNDSDVLANGDKDDMPHYKLGDVCEIFIKSECSNWYWEIWLTPHGKKTSTFWIGPGQKGVDHAKNYKLDMQYTTKINGTLNDSRDIDKSWSFEVSIPFKEITQNELLYQSGKLLVFWGRQNFNGSVDKDHRMLSMYPLLSKPNFHLTEEYAQLILK